jgi:hypothetical protein
MSDLTAIVKATRASAAALKAEQRLAGEMSDATAAERKIMYRKVLAARQRYQRAQEILAANPLPGDAR